MTEILAALKGEEGLSSVKVGAAGLARLIKMIDSGQLSGKMAKEVMEEMLSSGAEPEAVVKAKGLVQISDDAALVAVIEAVLAENADNLAHYRAGKTKLFGFFVGQVMARTKGQANPAKVNELLRKRLDG
jgi:aspartyl-tRNA(Asn)/glutamyl-tRNA(Gln) amidotransferase subunit B